jgi:ABC-type sugar transport system ATPase subunit
LVRDDLTVLLGDEPFSNLDPTLRRSLRREFRDVSKEFKLATIVVTHDQSDASMADRVAIMFDGCLHQIGTFDEIYAHPADVRVAQFVGLVPPNLIPASLLYPDWPDAMQYILALRPETIIVSAELDGQLVGSVVAVERLPPLQWIEVETRSVRLLVADPTAAHPIASRVGLQWKPQSVQWFLSATGQRCDAPRAAFE